MHTPWSHSAVARWHLQMVHISLKLCAHLSQAVRFSHSHQWGLVENYYATIARYHSCMVLMPITSQFLGWLVVGTTPKIYFEHQLVGWSDFRHWCTDWIETLVCKYTPNHEADGSMIDITICYILYMCSKHASCVVFQTSQYKLLSKMAITRRNVTELCRINDVNPSLIWGGFPWSWLKCRILVLHLVNFHVILSSNDAQIACSERGTFHYLPLSLYVIAVELLFPSLHTGKFCQWACLA